MQFTLAEFFERCAGVQFALIKCFAHCYWEFSLSFFLDSQQTWFICRLHFFSFVKSFFAKKSRFPYWKISIFSYLFDITRNRRNFWFCLFFYSVCLTGNSSERLFGRPARVFRNFSAYAASCSCFGLRFAISLAAGQRVSECSSA